MSTHPPDKIFGGIPVGSVDLAHLKLTEHSATPSMAVCEQKSRIVQEPSLDNSALFVPRLSKISENEFYFFFFNSASTACINRFR
jgi:hypothetical protein